MQLRSRQRTGSLFSVFGERKTDGTFTWGNLCSFDSFEEADSDSDSDIPNVLMASAMELRGVPIEELDIDLMAPPPKHPKQMAVRRNDEAWKTNTVDPLALFIWGTRDKRIVIGRALLARSSCWSPAAQQRPQRTIRYPSYANGSERHEHIPCLYQSAPGNSWPGFRANLREKCKVTKTIGGLWRTPIFWAAS
jgi:hypothetical protein